MHDPVCSGRMRVGTQAASLNVMTVAPLEPRVALMHAQTVFLKPLAVERPAAHHRRSDGERRHHTHCR